MVAEFFGHHRKGSFSGTYERVSPSRLGITPSLQPFFCSPIESSEVLMRVHEWVQGDISAVGWISGVRPAF